MKEKQFDDAGPSFLNMAAEFYSRLEDLLKDQTDRESRRHGQAYDETGSTDGEDRRPGARRWLGATQGPGGASIARVEAGADAETKPRCGAKPERRRLVAEIDR